VVLPLDIGSAAAVNYSIAPRGTLSFFANSGATDIRGYADVVPNSGSLTPVAYASLVHTESNQVTLRETVEAQVPGSDFRLYGEWSGNFDGGALGATAMSFTLSNPSSTPTTVTLTLVGMDGTATGLSKVITLPAQGHLTSFLHQLAPFTGMPNPFQGILLVHATGSGVTVFGMRDRIGENGVLVGTTTGPIKENPGSGTQVVYPYILEGGGYGTEFIMFSDPTGTGTAGTITFLNDSGTAIPVNIP
jgi:hypothetical protein